MLNVKSPLVKIKLIGKINFLKEDICQSRLPPVMQITSDLRVVKTRHSNYSLMGR